MFYIARFGNEYTNEYHIKMILEAINEYLMVSKAIKKPISEKDIEKYSNTWTFNDLMEFCSKYDLNLNYVLQSGTFSQKMAEARMTESNNYPIIKYSSLADFKREVVKYMKKLMASYNKTTKKYKEYETLSNNITRKTVGRDNPITIQELIKYNEQLYSEMYGESTTHIQFKELYEYVNYCFNKE